MLFNFIKRFWLVNPEVRFFPSFGGGGASTGYLYNIGSSVRLRSSSNGVFVRTPTTIGNTKKFTLSMTVRRGSVGSGITDGLLGVYNPNSYPNLLYNSTGFHFNGDSLVFYSTSGTGTYLAAATTNAKFREPFAPYHIVLAVDTTQATAALGIKMWVNGVAQTYSATNWTQNLSTYINTLIPHYIGRTYGGNAGTPISWQNDCVISEVNFIDGQQLDVSNFGAMDSATNSWKQSKYTGSYTGNSYYLPFTDASSLENLGHDQSITGGTAAIAIPLASNTTGWANYGYRQVIAGSSVLANGNKVRLTLSGGTTGVDISGVMIGYKATSGNAWDFSGNQVQVTFGGSNNISIAANGTAVSDWVTFPLVSNLAQGYVIAVAFAGTGSGSVLAEPSSITYSTPGTVVVTVPPGVTSVTYQERGAGGGGGAGANNPASGGGSGYSATGTLTVSPGEILTLTIGTGGAGAPADGVGSDGSAGTATIINYKGTNYTANPGQGGGGSTSAGPGGAGAFAGSAPYSGVGASSNGGGGGGGTGGAPSVSAGTVSMNGGIGTNGFTRGLSAVYAGGGGGGGGDLGNGANGGNAGGAGGKGGGGGGGSGDSTSAGGRGGDGYVTLTFNSFTSLSGYQKAADSANALTQTPAGYVASSYNALLISDIEVQGNNFTPSGVSLTPGNTYDLFNESATNKYCCLNIRDNLAGAPIADAGLTLDGTAIAANYYPFRGTFPISKGKWYYEVNVATNAGASANGNFVGIMAPTDSMATLSGSAPYTPANQGFMLFANYGGTGAYYSSNYGTYTNQNVASTTSDIIGVAIDIDNGYLWFSINGTWVGGGNPATGANPTYSSGISGKTWLPAGYVSGSGGRTQAWNFGQKPFVNNAPSGFNTICTNNLSDPINKDPGNNFSISLYSGSGAAKSVVNDGLYSDLTWIKERNVAGSNTLFDSIRGVTKYLLSDSTAIETTNATTLTAFNANGFSLGTDSLGTVNKSGSTYAAWQWNANNGVTSVNNDGSIATTVNVNTKTGLSIVTYTGTGSSGEFIGHGLGTAPRLILIKERNATSQWTVYHVSANGGNGAAGNLCLNTTAAFATDSTMWLAGAPSSTVFTIGNNVNVNTSGKAYVAYCFTDVPDFSKVGSFTGNGNVNGTFVNCGFRPRFILLKSSNIVDNWDIIDTSRDIWNGPNNLLLAPNSSVVEASASILDVYSNGFKMLNASSFNGNGNTVLYYAIAEQTLKYATGR